MTSIQRRAARSLFASSSRPRHPPITQIRHYAKAKEPERPQISDEKDAPYLVGTPIFPIPRDPFAPPPARRLTPAYPTDPEAQGSPSGPPPAEYSETQKKWVMRIATLMGYNSQASTAIRETQRMLGGIVEAVEKDADFWYGECQLPPTYQTFFQLHMLYVLMLIPRLRALPVNVKSTKHPIPEPADPSPPKMSEALVSSPATSSSTSLFSKPTSSRYVTEFVSIFFELAESQMRRVFGRNERERVIKKYMKEFGEQFKGCSVGMDFILSLRFSEDPKERATADLELASWLWRNLFASRGLGPPSPEFVAPDEVDAYSVTELYMLPQIETISTWIRREMARLDRISDQDVLDGNIGPWPKVKST